MTRRANTKQSEQPLTVECESLQRASGPSLIQGARATRGTLLRGHRHHGAGIHDQLKHQNVFILFHALST